MIKNFIQAEVKAVNIEEGTFEILASTGNVDRLGDTINPKGWYLKNYKKNPVILWSHSTGGFGSAAIPPVAKAVKVWIENEKELKIKGQFAETPFAQELRTLVEGGFLNAVSVGFLPLVEDKKGDIEMESKMYRRATDEETKKGIYDSEYGENFTKQELLEVSWVSVPALPQALVSAKDMKLSLVTKALEKEIEDNPKEKEEEKAEEAKEETKEEAKEEKAKVIEPASKKEGDITAEQFNKIEDFILDTEKTMSVLKDTLLKMKKMLPGSGTTPSEDEKGRKPFAKRKSKEKDDMERLLIMFDKMCEALLRKLRQKKNENN